MNSHEIISALDKMHKALKDAQKEYYSSKHIYHAESYQRELEKSIREVEMSLQYDARRQSKLDSQAVLVFLLPILIVILDYFCFTYSQFIANVLILLCGLWAFVGLYMMFRIEIRVNKLVNDIASSFPFPDEFIAPLKMRKIVDELREKI